MDALSNGLDLAAYWWWLAIGLSLIFLELATGTLFLLWPGVSAILFAGVIALFPDLGLAAQISLYAALAIILTVIGRSYFRMRPSAIESDRPLLNRRGEQLVGRRVEAVGPFSHGYGAVRLDDGQWSARIDAGESDAVAAGDSLVIKSVEGSTLIVGRP